MGDKNNVGMMCIGTFINEMVDLFIHHISKVKKDTPLVFLKNVIDVGVKKYVVKRLVIDNMDVSKDELIRLCVDDQYFFQTRMRCIFDNAEIRMMVSSLLYKFCTKENDIEVDNLIRSIRDVYDFRCKDNATFIKKLDSNLKDYGQTLYDFYRDNIPTYKDEFYNKEEEQIRRNKSDIVMFENPFKTTDATRYFCGVYGLDNNNMMGITKHMYLGTVRDMILNKDFLHKRTLIHPPHDKDIFEKTLEVVRTMKRLSKEQYEMDIQNTSIDDKDKDLPNEEKELLLNTKRCNVDKCWRDRPTIIEFVMDYYFFLKDIYNEDIDDMINDRDYCQITITIL
jgi:hypothetical protein